jgi:hypothetical protein
MKNDRLSEKLNRLGQHLTGGSSRQSKSSAPAQYKKLSDAVGGQLVDHSAGCYVLVRQVYPFGFSLGNECLDPVKPSTEVAVSSFSAADREGEVPLSRLLFFDTETTGLGGAGAVPFLVGCGSMTSEGFEVRQYLLPDYSDEAAMLEEVLAEFDPETTLVSYNGIAFDANLLRDRMIINRVARELPQADHFDLLHSARRLWRRRLADCRLTNIERELFGFYRDDDIPGHLIPSVYFDWLHSDDLRFMNSVLEHNRFDILSLYFLLRRIDQVFRSQGASLDATDDLYSLSRVYGRRRQPDKVIDTFDTLRQSATEPLGPEVIFYHSLAFKRRGDWSRAVELWLELAEQTSRESREACLELAKYYEHRAKDPQQALNFTRQADQKGTSGPRQKADLQKRVERLGRKLGR